MLHKTNTTTETAKWKFLYVQLYSDQYIITSAQKSYNDEFLRSRKTEKLSSIHKILMNNEKKLFIHVEKFGIQKKLCINKITVYG